MKKLITKLGILAVCISLMPACKKDKDSSSDDNNQQPASKVCKITRLEDSDGNITLYYYNSNGKIDKMLQTDGTDTSVSTYTYAANVVTVDNGESGPLQTYYLNSKGLVDSMVMEMEGLMEIHIVAKYNANDRVIEQKISGYVMTNTVDQTSTYEYSAEGNMTKQTASSSGGSTYVYTFDYYMDKLNKASDFELLSSFTKANTNMLKKTTSSDGSFTEYTYEYNSDGLATKTTSLDDEGTQTVNNTTWLCQ